MCVCGIFFNTYPGLLISLTLQQVSYSNKMNFEKESYLGQERALCVKEKDNFVETKDGKCETYEKPRKKREMRTKSDRK